MHGSFSGRDAEATLIESLRTATSTEQAVVLLRDRLGVDNVTCFLLCAHGPFLDTPYIRTTYPPQWIARYLLKGYLKVDPVMREGLSRTAAFAWHELQWDEEERRFLADALDHGLGDKGYAVPCADRFARRSLLTLNAGVSEPAWTAFIAENAAMLERVARVVHEMAAAECCGTAPPSPVLAPRERECLLWTARGKEAKAIAAILNISEYTVRSYLRMARQKLECRTLSQAVAKAMRGGMIDP